MARIERDEADGLDLGRKHPKQKKGNDQEVPLVLGPFVLAGKMIDPLEIIMRQERKGKLIFPYRATSVSTAFTRAVHACKIDNLHFHDLRHHGCSLFFEAGYSIEQVALVSGHRDWNMLRRYTKLRPETLHRDLPATVVPMAAATKLDCSHRGLKPSPSGEGKVVKSHYATISNWQPREVRS